MSRVCESVKLWWRPPDPREDDSVQHATEWYRNLDSGSINSGILPEVRAYAKEKYGEKTESFRSLDAKSEKLFQFSAGAAAAVFVIAKSLDGNLSFALLCAYGLFAAAMIVAVRVHATTWTSHPMPANQVIDDVPRKSATHIQLKLAGSYHVAATGLEVVNRWKASQIRRVHKLFVFGVLLVLLGLVLQQINRPSASPGAAGTHSGPTQPDSDPSLSVPSEKANPETTERDQTDPTTVPAETPEESKTLFPC